jgi:hypothetical protein
MAAGWHGATSAGDLDVFVRCYSLATRAAAGITAPTLGDPMHTTVNGSRLHFDVEGPKLVPDGATMRERPTLLLLHGGPGFDHSSYKPDFARLADLAQVVYLDHRGQGRSDKSEPAFWNLDQWADDVHDFCEALNIGATERGSNRSTGFGLVPGGSPLASGAPPCHTFVPVSPRELGGGSPNLLRIC